MVDKPILLTPSGPYPQYLFEVLNSEGETRFIESETSLDGELIDRCSLLDSALGIYARDRQVDTIYLTRDLSESGRIFIEC